MVSCMFLPKIESVQQRLRRCRYAKLLGVLFEKYG